LIIAILAVYGAILALLAKLGLISWNRFWAISIPALWAILQLALLIPMGWGNPQGPALVLRNTVQIAPDVAGEVFDVPVVANTPVKSGDILFRIDPVPYEASVNAIKAQLTLQEERLAIDAKLEERDVRSRIGVLERKAAVDNLRAQLEAAKWNLDKTIVHAPADGFVTNVALRKGAHVASAPVMAFIDTSVTGVGVEIAQSNARYIAPDQSAELAFKFAPGAIFTGKVRTVVQAISTGQITPSGLAATPILIQSAPFVVVIDLDDQAFARQLPMGATGDAAIFTEHGTFNRFLRRVILRQISILNYVNPL
jgi:multidrug resistance efflux pump